MKKLPGVKVNVEIDLHMKNGARFQVFRSRSRNLKQAWWWRLIAGNGKNVASSGEGYADKLEARQIGIDVVSGRYYSGD